MTTAKIHNYVDDGTTLEKMKLALEAISMLTSLCGEVNEGYQVSPRRFSILLDVLLLRVEQVYQSLLEEEEARREQGIVTDFG